MAKVSSATVLAVGPALDTAVDAYIAKTPPFAQPILLHLRDIVHQAAPGVEEAIKWSRPFFVYRGIILANMAGFRQHCSFGLWGEEAVSTLRSEGAATGGPVSGSSMGSFGRITSLDDLPPRSELLRYVKLAAQAIDSGERTSSIPRPRPRVNVAKPAGQVPEGLSHALNGNKLAARNFATMSPSCRREYNDWIAGVKREETRQKRVATAVEWIAEGKSRDWKYERC
jgi:uncharacterized protein YdeI (YjbR/CyaY-like superfamily)